MEKGWSGRLHDLGKAEFQPSFLLQKCSGSGANLDLYLAGGTPRMEVSGIRSLEIMNGTYVIGKFPMECWLSCSFGTLLHSVRGHILLAFPVPLSDRTVLTRTHYGWVATETIDVAKGQMVPKAALLAALPYEGLRYSGASWWWLWDHVIGNFSQSHCMR